MLEEYEDIFKKRGDLYHHSMLLCPNAREDEFAALIKTIPENQRGLLLDIPSGGMYLKPYLDKSHPNLKYEGFDPSPQFTSLHAGLQESFEFQNLHWEDEYADIVVTLAATHHITEREKYYQEAYRILKPGGIFIVGDVLEGSKQHTFLNGFVNDHNSMGHLGTFLNEEKELQSFSNVGFKKNEFKAHNYQWNFKNLTQCTEFCRGLFGLDKANKEQISRGLDTYLDLIIADKYTKLGWQLGFWKGVKSKQIN